MKYLRYFLVLSAIVGAPSFGLAPRAAAEDLDADALYAKVVKSCVFIIRDMGKKGFSMGSGSLIDAEKRLVLTNFHVTRDEPFVYIQFPMYVKGELITDKEKYLDRWLEGKVGKSKVLFTDKNRDLAIVQVDKVPLGTSAIPLAKDSPPIGATVWQIGNAGSISSAFRTSKGDVSAVGPEKMTVGGGDTAFLVDCKMVTSTAPTNRGDSGGPLFDKRGYQVAVTESGHNGVTLVNRFVDVTEVRKLLAEHKMKIKELSDEPDPKGEPKEGGGPKKGPDPKKDGSSTASPEDERAAAGLLQRSKLFANGDDNRPTYIDRLNEIIKKYPTTTAAKEAKKILSGLK